MNYYNTKVTVELREMIENGVNVWDFDYPSFYRGEEKTTFESKVLDHFYFRQIGHETVGRFLHAFRTKVREIMPYYIDMYNSVKLFKEIPDPLQSYDLTEKYTKTGTVKSTTVGSGNATVDQDETNSSERRFSDTPQGSVSNLDSYLTDATRENATVKGKNTSNTSTNETVDGNDSEEYTLRRYGNIGVQPLGDEIKKLRDAYINVDMMVIAELEGLFLKIY